MSKITYLTLYNVSRITIEWDFAYAKAQGL